MSEYHKNKHIREAIKYAIDRGWSYEKKKGKGDAVGRCAASSAITSARCRYGERRDLLKTTPSEFGTGSISVEAPLAR